MSQVLLTTENYGEMVALQKHSLSSNLKHFLMAIICFYFIKALVYD